MNEKDLAEAGSCVAKNGFKNENEVICKFNNWQKDLLAQQWLKAMDYDIDEIDYVVARKVKGGFKADIQVQIKVEVKLKTLLDVQNLQIKLVSNKSGFNQIDKRWVDSYVNLWNIPDKIAMLLKHFTGEILPYISNSRDKRRMFINEFTENEQNSLLNFIKVNQSLIVSDILKGRGQFSAEWMLVIRKIKEKDTQIDWVLKPMNFCLNFFGNGEVLVTKRGSIKIGKITIQRKGGDGGRKTSQMLQFKINPCLLFLTK